MDTCQAVGSPVLAVTDEASLCPEVALPETRVTVSLHECGEG